MDDFIDELPIFEAVTDGVRVTTQSYFLAGQSNPEDDHYVWAYRIRIANESGETVQLMSRHWIITDASGHSQEVQGDGVIGEQPVIAPGADHSYMSGTPLNTPTGFMAGSYGMIGASGRRFDIVIPGFSLDSPYFTASVN